MSTLSQFAGGGLPVGSIVQAPYNLTDPDYLPCDGRAVLRSQYPLLSACLPNIGTFTATARTKTTIPTSSAIAADGTSWVVTGAVGTSNLYTTTDGITYTARTTPATCDVRSILYDGVNFVAAVTGAGQKHQYSTNGGVTWQATASTQQAPVLGLQTCMTWAPTLGTVGRFCVANGTAFHTSDDRGVTWTDRPHNLGGNVFHVCWTGQRFLAITGINSVIYTSTDGITWVSQAIPFNTDQGTASTGSIISDGNGRVLWRATTLVVATSTDHGVTWCRRQFASEFTGGVSMFNADSTTMGFTNNRFFIRGSVTAVFVSSDLISWIVDAGLFGVGATFGICHKSGVYLVNATNASTSAFTVVEDVSKIILPGSSQNQATNNGSWNNFMPFIKVK